MRICRKLKNRGGFSLVEMLIAMLILTMMSMVACMGISTAMEDRAKAITVADAQAVASTAAQALGDQIRYGRINAVESDHVELTSSTYGSKVKLRLEDGRLVAENAAGVQYALLGEKAYSGLRVDALTFAGHETEPGVVDWVDISLTVAGGIWSLNWKVAPLNPYLVTT